MSNDSSSSAPRVMVSRPASSARPHIGPRIVDRGDRGDRIPGVAFGLAGGEEMGDGRSRTRSPAAGRPHTPRPPTGSPSSAPSASGRSARPSPMTARRAVTTTNVLLRTRWSYSRRATVHAFGNRPLIGCLRRGLVRQVTLLLDRRGPTDVLDEDLLERRVGDLEAGHPVAAGQRGAQDAPGSVPSTDMELEVVLAAPVSSRRGTARPSRRHRPVIGRSRTTCGPSRA